MASLLETR